MKKVFMFSVFIVSFATLIWILTFTLTLSDPSEIKNNTNAVEDQTLQSLNNDDDDTNINMHNISLLSTHAQHNIDANIINHDHDGIALNCAVLCCGLGDRYRVMFNQLYLALRHESFSLINWHWGPCAPVHSFNVLHHIFESFGSYTITNHRANRTDIITVSIAPQSNKSSNCAQVTQLPLHQITNHEFWIKNHPVAQLVAKLQNSVSKDINDTIHSFMNMYRFNDVFTVGVHIRYGNPGNISNREFDADFEIKQRAEIMRKSLNIFIERHLKQIKKVMKILAVDKYQILFITDTALVQDFIFEYNQRNLDRNRLLFIRPQKYNTFAHPLLWSNLHETNRGNECNIKWFTDGVIDELLLSKVDLLVSTSTTGFTLFPQISVYHKHKYVCYANHQHVYDKSKERYMNKTLDSVQKRLKWYKKKKRNKIHWLRYALRDKIEYLCINKKYPNMIVPNYEWIEARFTNISNSSLADIQILSENNPYECAANAHEQFEREWIQDVIKQNITHIAMFGDSHMTRYQEGMISYLRQFNTTYDIECSDRIIINSLLHPNITHLDKKGCTSCDSYQIKCVINEHRLLFSMLSMEYIRDKETIFANQNWTQEFYFYRYFNSSEEMEGNEGYPDVLLRFETNMHNFQRYKNETEFGEYFEWFIEQMASMKVVNYNKDIRLIWFLSNAWRS